MHFTAFIADSAWATALQTNGTATIDSVFRRALNLRTESGELLSIFPSGSPNNPNGLVGSHAAGEPLGQVGEEVQITPTAITFTTAVISLEGCQFVSNELTNKLAKIPSGERIKQFESSVRSQAIPGSFYGALASDTFNQAQVTRLESSREDLVQAIEHTSLAQIADATKHLVGLGVGLTPSGDDYLLGLMLVLDQSVLASSQSTASIKQAIRDNMTATTNVSQQYLIAGLARQYAEPLRTLCEQVSRENQSFETALATVMDHGATSGQDACTGMTDGWNLLHTITKRRFEK